MRKQGKNMALEAIPQSYLSVRMGVLSNTIQDTLHQLNFYQ